MDKHSYIDEKKKGTPDSEKKQPGSQANDQKNIKRTDPDLKKGYNEKNPGQPQGGFTPDSQADTSKEKTQGDESK